MVFTPASKLRQSALKASLNGKLATFRQAMRSTNFGDGQDGPTFGEGIQSYTARQIGEYASRPHEPSQFQTNGKAVVRASVFDVEEY